MEVTKEWISGITEAEGCFSIYITVEKGIISVNFVFSITQKDTQFLYAIEAFLLENVDPHDFFFFL
jgi:hypothetical protein